MKNFLKKTLRRTLFHWYRWEAIAEKHQKRFREWRYLIRCDARIDLYSDEWRAKRKAEVKGAERYTARGGAGGFGP
jgi:hypothetical protein